MKNAYWLFILFFLIVFCIIMWIPHYYYLIWNLVLAAIPFLLAKLIHQTKHKGVDFIWGVMWALFYPNAFYMVTDFIHFQNMEFYELSLSGTFVYNMDWKIWLIFGIMSVSVFFGLLLGYYSWRIIVQYLNLDKKPLQRNLLVMILSIAVGIALYLGRVLRHNSWDAFVRPLEIFRGAYEGLMSGGWKLILIFTLVHFIYILLLDYIDSLKLRKLKF